MKARPGRRCLYLPLLLLVACTEPPSDARPAAEPAPPSDTTNATNATSAASARSGTPATTPAAPASSPDEWRVTPTGFGPVRIGMTAQEANAALDGRLAVPDPLGGCQYANPIDGPTDVLFMLVDGRVVRVDIGNPSIATGRGARIGDSEARIQALYPGRVEVQPHKYTAGHYLIVTPTEPADSAYRIIFETDGETVTRYRAGMLPQVQWVEGCA